ncbi:MAG: DUF951 domain-containing protein [Clostridia bacterium]|nr:DUF951 domain-containing protein [Clostridia bacterium]
MPLHLGDVVRLKKPHPCGSDRWEIVRVGADLRLKCLGCGHLVLLPRSRVESKIREIYPAAAPPGTPPLKPGRDLL